MERFLFLTGIMDLRKFKSTCNFKSCAAPPSKEVIIKEFDVHRDMKRDVVSLYVCSEHFKTIAPIIERFNALSTGKIISTEVKETGIVTH